VPSRQDDRRHAPEVFRPDCTLCPRLARHLDEMRAAHPSYHNAPVALFGAAKALLLIVGLRRAPMARTHRSAVHRRPRGTHSLCHAARRRLLASQRLPCSRAAMVDLEELPDQQCCQMPAPREQAHDARDRHSEPYLAAEIERSPEVRAILALGAIAHRAGCGAALAQCTDWHGRGTVYRTGARSSIRIIAAGTTRKRGG
jgi:uracil-DNA glycosylase